jgi:hypothetical protein
MIRINHVISLGTQCHTANYLKQNNLKFVSYPFDWIFSNPFVICDMLDDKFQKFLNKDYYGIKDENSNINKHLLYLPELNMFNHKNPYRKDDHDYYTRCVNRFYDFLKMEGKKLFIMTILKNNIHNEIDNIHLLKNKLEQITSNFEFIVIFQEKTGVQSKTVHVFDNLKVVQITTIDDSDGNIFLNNNDSIFYDLVIKDFYYWDVTSPGL